MGLVDKKLEKASRAKRVVTVCLDGEGASERDALYRRLVAAGTAEGRVSKSPTKAVQAEIDALEERLQDALLRIEVLGLSPAQWSAIKRGCPPAKDAVSRHYGFNVEVAVQQALIEASWAVEGDEREKITKQQWETLFSDEERSLSGGDWERLAQAVIELNQSSASEAIARGKV